MLIDLASASPDPAACPDATGPSARMAPDGTVAAPPDPEAGAGPGPAPDDDATVGWEPGVAGPARADEGGDPLDAGGMPPADGAPPEPEPPVGGPPPGAPPPTTVGGPPGPGD